MTSPRAVARRQPPPFTVEELRQIADEISADWFRPDPASHLTLFEIDPWQLHASWHIDPAAFAASRQQWQGQGSHERQLVLRFFDLSPQQWGIAADAPFDIAVHPASEQHYVKLWRDGRHYLAELGWRDDQGHFQALLRSNEVTLPRAGPSPVRDDRTVELNAELNAALTAPVAAPVSPAPPTAAWLDHLIAPLLPPLDAMDFLTGNDLGDSTEQMSVPPLPPLSPLPLFPADGLPQKVGAGGTAADGVADVSSAFPLPTVESSPVGGFRPQPRDHGGP